MIKTQIFIKSVDKLFLPKHANTHTHPTSTHINLKTSMNLELPCVWVFTMIEF